MNDYVRLFFGLYLVLGFWLSSDYGISMDEPIQRKHGMVAFEYINQKFGPFPNVPDVTGESLAIYDHRDYGMFFQTVAYGLELLLGIDNSRDVFRLRHQMVFFLFWLGSVFFYKAVYLRFGSRWLAFAGVMFLILSPRIFADSFYNPKDIPLLSWFMISTYTLLRFRDKKNTSTAFWHSLSCALAIGSRVVGVILPVLTIVIMVLDYFYTRPGKKELYRSLSILAFYLLLTLVFTIILWPVLWENPIDSFLHSFNSMKKFRWYGSMLYMGEMVSSTSIPWHYIPVWILVSTPVTITLLFIYGVINFAKDIIFKGLGIFGERENQMDLILFGLFFLPLLSVIFFGSVLYNGWRHLYFIYPAMVWFSLRGLHEIWVYFNRHSKYRFAGYGLLALMFVNFADTVYFIVRYHPHQSVYFNDLAGDVERNFERDYYGMSYKLALGGLLDYDKNDTIKIYSKDFIGKINTMNFTKKEASRLLFVNSAEDADYFVTIFNFRTQKEHQEMLMAKFPFDQKEIFCVKVKDYRTLSVFELNKGNHSSIVLPSQGFGPNSSK